MVGLVLVNKEDYIVMCLHDKHLKPILKYFCPCAC